MHEPDIAPLARRLAEENNVDWRRLSGTGEGGRVVERDVLGYLARVMAGVEAVDPTPEPVPEGMAAWPEEDVGGYGARDLDDEPGSPPTLDDDLFLLDDPLPPADDAGEDALFVTADDARAEAPVAPVATDDEDGAGAGPSGIAGASEGEDGVWLVGDEAADEEDGAASAATDAATGDDDDEVYVLGGGRDDDDEMRIDELPDLTVGERAIGARAGEDETARLPGGREALELPDLFADDGAPPVVREAAADVLSLDDGDALDLVDVERDAGTGPTSEGASSELNGLAASAPAAATAPVAATAPLLDRGAGAGASTEPALAVTLVRHGQLWRRRFDDRPLRQVASDAAAALDVAPTTMVVLLMARAAQRAGVARRSIDAWRWRRDGAERFVVDSESAVREAARAVEARASGVDDAPAAGLVVADLGDLGVDEAVLHLDAPVLALGRSSGDGAWLSLSGDDLDGAAAAGLARVAELLGSPVRLLL